MPIFFLMDLELSGCLVEYVRQRQGQRLSSKNIFSLGWMTFYPKGVSRELIWVLKHHPCKGFIQFALVS